MHLKQHAEGGYIHKAYRRKTRLYVNRAMHPSKNARKRALKYTKGGMHYLK